MYLLFTVVNSNYAGTNGVDHSFTTDQLARAASNIRLYAEYAEKIRTESLPPVTVQGVVPFCMDGYKSVSNAADRFLLLSVSILVRLHDCYAVSCDETFYCIVEATAKPYCNIVITDNLASYILCCSIMFFCQMLCAFVLCAV